MSFLHTTLVLIPALNEALCVAETVQTWKALGAGHVRVVDNGSTDDTATRATAAGADVVHEPRRGYGSAAWRGLQQLPTGVQWVLFSSADGSDRLSAEDLVKWQHAIENGSELLIGDRVSVAASREQLKAVQSFGNWLCCRLIQLGWGHCFSDMGSLRLIHRSAIERMNLQDRGFGWNVEMQVRALEHGIRVSELPVAYYPRRAGQSKISGNFMGTIRASRGILIMVFRLWRTRKRHR